MEGVRIVFAGTPSVAVPALHALREHHQVVAVLTRPDAPVGRKRIMTPSPVKTAALEAGIDVIEASHVDDDVCERIAQYQPDAGAVVAYGALLKDNALSLPTHGWFNLHFSLLPAYRGAAPVQWALINGETTTGLTVFQLDRGMDTGPVLDQREYPLPKKDAGDMLEEFAHAGAQQLTEALTRLENGDATLVPQSGEATYAPKLSAQDAHLNFALPARELVARSHGVSPMPGPWSTMDGKRTKLAGLSETQVHVPVGEIREHDGQIFIGTGTTAVQVERIQPFGKPMMDAHDFVRGNANAVFDVEGQ